MLTVWLKCTNPPPTWTILTEALESAPVGEGLLAQQLRDKYCPSTERGVAHDYPTQRPSSPIAHPASNISSPQVSPLSAEGLPSRVSLRRGGADADGVSEAGQGEGKPTGRTAEYAPVCLSVCLSVDIHFA